MQPDNMDVAAKRQNQQVAHHPKRRRTRKALWLGLFVVLAVVGGRWVWRQVQFSRLRIPLIQAVQARDRTRVRDLLEQGADPDVRLDYQHGPFSWNSVLQIFHSDRTGTSGAGITVLMWAVQSHDAPTVRLLLEHGANVHLTDYTGREWTALHWAASEGAVDCVEALAAYDTDINAWVDDHTPLLRASYADGSADSVRSQHDAGNSCVGVLLQHGADAKVRQKDGTTPLMIAAEGSCCLNLRLLLKHGVDVNARDKEGRTALLRAGEQLEPLSVRTLLDNHADPDIPDNNGRTVFSSVLKSAHDLAEEKDYAERSEWRACLATLRILLDSRPGIGRKEASGKTSTELAGSITDPQLSALLRNAAARTSGAAKGAGR